MPSDPPRVAVVGAGVAGLAAATLLTDAGRRVILFDKGRGVGGRTSTRRVETLGRTFRFDHGTTNFTVGDDDPAFADAVDAWSRAGVVRRWEGRLACLDVDGPRAVAPGERYVGVGGMNGVCKHLLSALPRDATSVSLSSRITGGAFGDGVWSLTAEDGPVPERFDALLLTLPPAQASELLGRLTGDDLTDLATRVGGVAMRPVWSLLGVWNAPGPDFDAACVSKTGRERPSGVNWMMRQSGPADADRMTPPAEGWVIHMTYDWSRGHLELDPATAAAEILREVAATGVLTDPPGYASAHRWRFASAEKPLGESHLLRRTCRLAVAGDWCPGAVVGSAFASGRAAAQALLSAENPQIS